MTEAVFSSSGDRIRAIGASTAITSPFIVSLGTHSRPNRFAIAVKEGIFAVLFPSECRICGDPLTQISRLPVCLACLESMTPITGGLCAVCGERVLSVRINGVLDGDQVRCGLCQRVERPFERAVAYGSYDGALRELIHLLKYGAVRPAANVLGRMLAEAIARLESNFADAEIALIPVPLFRRKLRWQEFNHAELIARAVVKVRGQRLSLKPELLERKRETVSQTGLTRHQRRENVRGAFALTNAAAVKGREVLVVDDVFTTGATVSECARVLRRAGAKRVWVATVARTLTIADLHIKVQQSDADIEAGQRIAVGQASGI
jgi:ComF family protein